jgi:hypothetical protein
MHSGGVTDDRVYLPPNKQRPASSSLCMGLFHAEIEILLA